MDIQTHIGTGHCSLWLTLHWGNRLLASEQLLPQMANWCLNLIHPVFPGPQTEALNSISHSFLRPFTVTVNQSKQLCLRTAAPTPNVSCKERAVVWCWWGMPADRSFSSTCALGLCYGLVFGVVQPFPYKWGNLNLSLFLFFWFIWKTENISLYFCFTACFSELLFVLLATIGDSTVFMPQKLLLPYSGLKT